MRLHDAEVGSFSIRKGAFMAGGCMWEVTFTGKGAHGGNSAHLAADLSIVQAHFVLGLQTIVGRNVPSLDTSVISVGYIHGGAVESGNVMPAELVVGGTARYFNPKVKTIIETRMRELAKHCAEMHGAGVSLRMNWMADPLSNSDAQTDVAIAAASALVGADAVDANTPAVTGGEDFAYMLQQRPGAFIFIGNGVSADGSYHGLHTPRYDFNDDIIPLGVAYWVSLVREELKLR
jgi:amidohydrolase